MALRAAVLLPDPVRRLGDLIMIGWLLFLDWFDSRYVFHIRFPFNCAQKRCFAFPLVEFKRATRFHN